MSKPPDLTPKEKFHASGGWNRIVLKVSDINAEDTRLRAIGVKFRRNDIVSGPGGSQFWVVDPSGNLVEIFQSQSI